MTRDTGRSFGAASSISLPNVNSADGIKIIVAPSVFVKLPKRERSSSGLDSIFAGVGFSSTGAEFEVGFRSIFGTAGVGAAKDFSSASSR